MFVLLIEWPLIGVFVLIILVTWRKGGDLKNIILLLGLLLGAITYLFVSKPFTFEEEFFILFGSLVIMSVVAIMAMLVHLLFGGGERRGVQSYLDEIKRKAFHFVAFLMFVPWDAYRAIYVQSVVGFNAMFGTALKPVQEGFLTFVIFLVAYSLMMLFTILESVRLLYVPSLFAKLLRPYELNRFASYLFSTAAIFLLSLFMYPYDNAFAAALVIGFLADLAACLVGMKFRKYAYNDRSLEGGLANFIVGFISGAYFVGLIAIPVALIIAVFDFINGALEINLNDNLVFPLLAGSLIRMFLIWG